MSGDQREAPPTLESSLREKVPVLKIENGAPVIVNVAELLRLQDESTWNENFLQENYGELLKLYPDKWVVIQGEAIAVVAETLQGNMESVVEQSIERGTCAIRFLQSKPRMLIV